jgi:hypothetical protein
VAAADATPEFLVGADKVTEDHPRPPEVFPSPKERIPPVYEVPEEQVKRTQRVVYQLEDTGHPLLRIRVTVRLVGDGDEQSVLYRAEAFSRVTGSALGIAEMTPPHDSTEAYVALARQFQTPPFRRVLQSLWDELAERYRDAVPEEAVQR